ncbi:hypothetical protein Shyhy02_14640 [Streptomyces hygroscopicus subsp. hygroscopicus]|nr:hypothetical protein Shyhy02_14640 [Streptomyces hygroscopicus subsp. hygroscopicus]
MSDYVNTSAKDASTRCLQCGAPITQKKGPGRAKRFCRPWCGRLYRRQTAVFSVRGWDAA